MNFQRRTFILVLTLFLLSHDVLAVFTCCPDNWLAYNGSCYYFGHNPAGFTEAEHYCRQHGGHLLHVDNAVENAFIKSHLLLFAAGEWWMGLSDEDVESVFKWIDNDEVATFTDWHTGEPRNFLHPDWENCVVFEKTFAFEWNDQSCTAIHPYPICERGPGECSSTTGGSEIIG